MAGSCFSGWGDFALSHPAPCAKPTSLRSELPGTILDSWSHTQLAMSFFSASGFRCQLALSENPPSSSIWKALFLLHCEWWKLCLLHMTWRIQSTFLLHHRHPPKLVSFAHAHVGNHCLGFLPNPGCTQKDAKEPPNKNVLVVCCNVFVPTHLTEAWRGQDEWILVSWS